LNELADMESSYTFGLQWTPHTKIKVDDDTARLQCILAALKKLKPAATLAMCAVLKSILPSTITCADDSLQVDCGCKLGVVTAGHAARAGHHARCWRARGRD
jgi:hypothetical protein